MKTHEIRAVYDDECIIVYQAYRRAIAKQAVRHQTFVSPFKMERMTWIKPSFFWMMYRAGWGKKEGQENILAIRMKREGFEWALRNACLSKYDEALHGTYEQWQEKLHNTPVRVQWDPERDMHLNELDYRSIQIGLSGIAVKKYVSEWIMGIENITELCNTIQSHIESGNITAAQALIPQEKVYPIAQDILQGL